MSTTNVESNRSAASPVVPSREEQLAKLRSESFDLLVVGAGSTGAGCALDAATRGLKVACVERGDFGNETSSRSTKLLWAGIRYLGTGIAALLSKDLITSPRATWQAFVGEMKLVSDAHRERRFLLETQPHLTQWVPIAVPIQSWFVWPPPMGHPLFAAVGVALPFVFKLYDALSNFTCPSSHVVGRKRAARLFPHLTQRIKYAQMFYEGQHNDARTVTAIALTAAAESARIANYVEVVDLLKDDVEDPERVTGVRVVDRASDNSEPFDVRASRVLFAGGPFTDEIRNLEQAGDAEPAVKGAAGTHIVLPGYYCSRRAGLLDINTSDGRFLFFLPWMGHTLVGTTDRVDKPVSDPRPPESDIRWILDEVAKYLDKSIQVRRSDVLSAWQGFRPLATDPHASPDAPVSREHIVSRNPTSGAFFVVGGKWTTYRQMAEDAVDAVVASFPDGHIEARSCRTLTTPLLGAEGYSKTLSIELIQSYGLSESCAQHLASTYGTRAWDVCKPLMTANDSREKFRMRREIVAGFPYLDLEIAFAVKEYVRTVKDFVGLRTRLAFLNVEAAEAAIPTVAKTMGGILGWTSDKLEAEIADAYEYVASFGGPVPAVLGESAALPRLATRSKTDVVDDEEDSPTALRRERSYDVLAVYRAIDEDGNGQLELHEVRKALEALGVPSRTLNKVARDIFRTMDTNENGHVTEEEFLLWWATSHESTEMKRRLGKSAMMTLGKVGRGGQGAMFG